MDIPPCVVVPRALVWVALHHFEDWKEEKEKKERLETTKQHLLQRKESLPLL
jgi:hypothetical protein